MSVRLCPLPGGPPCEHAAEGAHCAVPLRTERIPAGPIHPAHDATWHDGPCRPACIGERCAWWLDELEECAIVALARRLGGGR